MARNWDNDRDSRGRGRDRGDNGYRHDEPYDAAYRPYALSPRSPYHDTEPRRRYSSRSPPYARPARDSRSRSPRRRDRSRARRDSAGPVRLPPGPPALLGRLEPVASRPDSRIAEPYSQRRERSVSRVDPKADIRPRSITSTLPRPMDRAAGQSAIGASVRPQGEASSSRSEHNVPQSASGAPSPRSPVKHDNSNKHTASASVVNTAQPNGMNAQTSTSSGAATPNGSIASPSRRPSTSAAPAPKSAPMVKKPSGSAQKRSESRSGKPTNKPKDAAARPEQEDKSGNATRTGGGHSAKDKGKATAYNPRVDPAVLNLVKANFALYNAEAMVDKYRVETFELEKAIGGPTKDMAPEDQLQFRQLMTEFGQHRDAAKKERDTVIISFEKALHPYLSKYMDGMLKDMLPAHLAKAKPKAQEVKIHDAASAAVATSNQMETGGLEPPPSVHSAMETETKSLSASATAIQDGPLVQHGAAAGSSNGLNGETLQTESTSEKGVVQVAEVNKVDAALDTVETSAPMEVDVDKPDRPLAIEPVDTSRHLQELVLPYPSPAHAALPNGTPVSLADGTTGSKQDRRKLVGERLKALEDGLRLTSTTTDELGIKLEKLEEQIASQEEQIYEYLNTQAIDTEIRPEHATTPLISAERPSHVTEEVTAEEPVPASKTEEAVLEMARAALDMRLEELARVQKTQMAAMAQANEARLSTLRNEIRAEISVEAARAEEAYAGAIQSAEAKAAKLEIQLASLQAELLSFKEERKGIEELKVQQQLSDQLLKTIRESTLKAQLTENQNRTSFNTKFGEIETRLDSHDSQLSNMRTFEQTKEAWRNDIIDMKNHVIGRVDYLEETIEGTRTPEVTARTNDQPTQPATAPRPETQSALQSTRENSAGGLQARPPTQSAIRPIQSAQSQTGALQPQFPPVPTTQQSAMHERSQYPTQSSLTSSADISQARLAINRGTGPSPLNSAPVTQAATASGHSAFQSSAGSLPGHTTGQQNLPATANHGFGQSWQPALSMQHPQGQPRLSPLHVDNEQGIYSPRSMSVAARTGSSGSPVPHVNPAPEGSLSSRLNGGAMRSPVSRPDSTAASTLPLVMRMHNGNGLPNSHNWMQSNNQTNPAGVNLNGGSAQQSLNEGASSGRLRMYAPGDTKPPQL